MSERAVLVRIAAKGVAIVLATIGLLTDSFWIVLPSVGVLALSNSSAWIRFIRGI